MVRILFIHPDLGIGGAERLVVDAALALKQKGHVVSFITNHHDSSHCFEETRDGTFHIETVGDWLPRKVFGRFYAFWAYVRMVYAACFTFFYARKERIDVIICDQISLGIPILKLARNNPKIIFYCHFPDQLLSQKGGILKSIYRAPLNYLEELTTGRADAVLVNSRFTRRIFKETFKRLDATPDVLYPSLNTTFFDQVDVSDMQMPFILAKDTYIFLSINRYERKKNLPLAVEAFKIMKHFLTLQEWEKCFLILAGGYDTQLEENVEHYKELETLAANLNISNKIALLQSPSDKQKVFLLKRAHCLLYTPANEHFGIVPLEGMYMAKPVIAANSGGPTETIIHESTGLLCDPKVEEFSKAMVKLFRDQRLGKNMGEMGRKRVQQKFSFEAFTYKMNCVVLGLITDKKIF